MNLPRSGFVSTLAAACALAPRIGAAQTAPVRIGVVPVEVCAEAFYGIDLGIFHKAGIDVDLQWFSSPGAGLDGVGR